MTYFKKNIEMLQEYDYKLYKRTKEWLTEEQSSSFSVVPAKNGQPTIKINQDGKTRYLTSAYNPTQEGLRWAKNQEIQENYVVVGFGLGYHLQHIYQQTNSVLVIEPFKDIFVLALKNLDLTWLFESNIRLSIAENYTQIQRKLGKIIDSFQDFGLLTSSSYSNIFPKEVLKTQKMISEIVGAALVNVNTFRMYARAWTNNFLENLPTLMDSPGIIGLFDKFKDIPGVIISSGPSLDKNVHLLHELKGKALLVAVGSAYKVLRKHEIEPDLIVSIDGSYQNYLHFKDMEIKVPLVFDGMIYSKIIEEYHGPLFSASVGNPFMAWFAEELDIVKGGLLVGPSVANVTLDLINKLGCNPMIFVGQDLAFPTGKTHANGTAHSTEIEATGHINDIYVEDIYGNEVFTLRSFLTFLRWFEGYIQEYIPNYKMVIDATEGGAKIEGTEILTLREVIDQYCKQEYPIHDWIHSYYSYETENNNIYYPDLIEALTKIIQVTEMFNKKSKRALSLVEDLELLIKSKNLHQKEISKIVYRLDQIDKFLLEETLESKVFLQIIFQPFVRPLMAGKMAQENKEETEQEFYERVTHWSKNLYDTLSVISGLVINMLKETRKKFENKVKGGLSDVK